MAHTAESLQQAFKYLFPNEVTALKELAQSLPPDPVVVNIGAGAGTSGLAFMESRPDLILVTVDIQHDDSPLGSLKSELNLLVDTGYISRDYYQVNKDSKIVGRTWKDGYYTWFTDDGKLMTVPVDKIDLVFVDGDHSYDGCKGDILAWLPNIKSYGIIAIHDYKKGELYAHDKDYQPDKPHPKPWPGVDKAVDELLVGKYEQIMRVDSLVAFRV